jgi:hypothetical protein
MPSNTGIGTRVHTYAQAIQIKVQCIEYQTRQDKTISVFYYVYIYWRWLVGGGVRPRRCSDLVSLR